MKNAQPQVRLPSMGGPWLILCFAFAATATELALRDFVGYYDATVLTLYGRLRWFPRLDFDFKQWLAGVIILGAVLLFLTPWAFRGAPFVRKIARTFAMVMLVESLLTVIASLVGQTVPSVHFSGGAPGLYTAPIGLAASILVLRQLRNPRKNTPVRRDST